MIPGMWSSYLNDQSPEDMVRTFAQKGWHNLELSTEHAQVLLDRGDPQQVGQAFRAFAADHGVRFPQGHLWLIADIAGRPDAQTQTIDTLRKWLDLFLAIDIHAGVLHPGGRALSKQGTPEEQLNDMRTTSLHALTDHIQGSDFVICLENGGGARTRAHTLVDIIQRAGRPNLGICLDTGHLNLGGGDQAEFIRTAGPYLRALHIADNEGQTDQHLMPFGRGTVAWHTVTHELNTLGYDGLFNFEIPGEARCPLPVRLAKLDYLKSILPILLGTAN